MMTLKSGGSEKWCWGGNEWMCFRKEESEDCKICGARSMGGLKEMFHD